jgi:pseudaminic acid synthase
MSTALPYAPVPFVVAELSGNHNQSLDRALAIVDAIADAGAHAVKLQTYTADTLTIPCERPEFRITSEGSLWQGETLYGLYQKAYTPWAWHAALFERCRQRGVIPFSTPFDETAVDFLDALGVPFFKIASFENVHLPLIRYAARKGKPLIISTGLASVAELAEAVGAARDAGCPHVTLLKCTSQYPAAPEQSHLRTLPHLRELFGCAVGLSDHTPGIGAAVASVALGAVMIEKHVTLSRHDGGVDSAFSLEPQELQALVTECARAHAALGGVQLGPTPEEKASLQFRRSLYVVADVQGGERLTPDNVRAIRPGLGLPPKYLDTVVGMVAQTNIPRGTPLQWDLLRASSP